MTEKLTSKQRAELRAQANSLEPLFQVGKGGVSPALVAQAEDALRVHELIKLKVLLESAPDTPRNIAEEIAEKTNCYKMMLLTGSKEESTLNFYRNAGYNSTDKTAFIQWIDM